MRAQHIDATIFLNAIIAAADRLRTARRFDGAPALRFDRRWTLLVAIEKCRGCPTLSDLAKMLGVRKQSIRALVVAAERAGVVEIFPSSSDRRAYQVALTPAGRGTLSADRLPESSWTFTLLNGLTPAAMRSTTQVLHVVTQRLARDEREMRRVSPRRR